MSNPRRKSIEDHVIDIVSDITHGNKENIELYQNLFKSMDDNQFDIFMNEIKDGKKHLALIVPNGDKVKVTFENNVKVAKKLGVDFFQHLKFGADDNLGTPAYTTPEKYLVLKLPLRRTSQIILKKSSVAVDNVSRDLLTDQVTSKSRARRLTYPEIQVLTGYGLNNAILELIKSRGGDKGEGNAMNMMLFRTGRANIETIRKYSTGVRSTKTLNAYFQAMHIRTTLV